MTHAGPRPQGLAAAPLRRRGIGIFAAIAVVALLFGACNDDGGAHPAAQTPLEDMPADPESYAERAFEAWRDGDRRVLEILASDNALNDFSRADPENLEGWEFVECEDGEQLTVCQWRSDEVTMGVVVHNLAANDTQPNGVAFVNFAPTGGAEGDILPEGLFASNVENYGARTFQAWALDDRDALARLTQQEPYQTLIDNPWEFEQNWTLVLPGCEEQGDGMTVCTWEREGERLQLTIDTEMAESGEAEAVTGATFETIDEGDDS
jgi:hypothetical protein